MFEVHVLNSAGIRNAKLLQKLFKSFLEKVEDVSGIEGREMAIVRTKLEEASFYAKKAMAMKSENQESPKSPSWKGSSLKTKP